MLEGLYGKNNYPSSFDTSTLTVLCKMQSASLRQFKAFLKSYKILGLTNVYFIILQILCFHF